MRRFLVAAATGIALMLVAAIPSAQAQTPSFNYSPTDPHTGEEVTFKTDSCGSVSCRYQWADRPPSGGSWSLHPNSSTLSSATLRFTFKIAGRKYVAVRKRRASTSRWGPWTYVNGATSRSLAGYVTVLQGPRVQPAPTPEPTPAPTPEPTPAPTPEPTPDGDQFPSPATTGVPSGWTPASTRSSDMTVTTNGAVIQDIRFTNGAKLRINAQNVIARRLEFEGGQIVTDQPGVLIEDVTLNRDAPETNGAEGVISYCGYTARRVEIINRSEGFRVGCGPATVIEDSYLHIRPPANCGDWHGDGIQGYTGRELHLRNVTIDFDDSTCGATSPFFWPSGQGNGSAHVDRLLIVGHNGYAFRLGTPGSVQDLRIQDRSWRFGPLTNVACGSISPWQAKIVTADGYRVTGTVRDLTCG